MCFSSQMSFGASMVLGTMGWYALKKAKKSEQFLAMVPVFFAIQQACEGIVWVTYNNPSYSFLTMAATYGFCFFAFFFWPIWIPIVVLKMEKNKKRKALVQFLLVIGTIVASVLAFALLTNGVQTTISCSHIAYNVFLPHILDIVGVVLYCMATILPLFLSTHKRLPLFGLLTLISVFVTYFFYTTFFTSVWCFFAALLSGMILWIL